MNTKSRVGPITIVTPNIAAEKMLAIVALSRAIEGLSKALLFRSVHVDISDVTISDVETGISVEAES